MHELWTTILAPVLDALRPRLVLDIGDSEGRLATLAAGYVQSWGGHVQRWAGPRTGQPSGRPSARAATRLPMGEGLTLPPGEADIVLLHTAGEAPSIDETIEAVAAASAAAGRPLPVILVHGVDADAGLTTALERFAEARAPAGCGLNVLLVPGLGGMAVLSESPLIGDAYGRLARLLDELRLPDAAARHLLAVEEHRLAERARAERAWSRLRSEQARALESEMLGLERDELRVRVRELAGAVAAVPLSVAASPVPSAAPPSEPSQADVRALLEPAELLRELGWEGAEEDLGLPISNNVIAEGQRFEWEWPTSGTPSPAPSIAYLLPGLPPEGSGGSHSLVAEARGQRALGAATRVCVPTEALERAQRLYGNDDGLFVAYAEEDAIVQVTGAADVVVSTEHTSMPLAQRIARERPEVVCAYYVQDYEPLFAPPGSARSDHALLSYRALSEQVLFAKTHWLRNVVMARHGVPVMKVAPSLDRSIFHAGGRSPRRDGIVRVAAMIRPRTPRRRARATLLALEAIARRLGEGVHVLTFGCDAQEFAALRAVVGAESAQAKVTHLGLLTRVNVAEAMRRTDVFIDASAYQAFGRTGLEAMACGAVPVLPALGGVREYAEHDRDAVTLAHDAPEAIADAVCALLGDRERLARLREAGLRSAARFSIERAARSQLGLFAAVTTVRAQRATVPA
jgi:hypothetical protein